jgi:tetratricopeptide (TPR) repeat protein
MTNQELLAAAEKAFNSGDPDRAIALLGSVNSGDPALYAQALVLMGRSHMRKQDLEQAKLCIEEAYTIRKTSRTLFYLGEVLYHSRDFAGAEECLEAATKTDETLTDAFILLGVVRKDAGRLKDAIPCFDRALKNDPKAVVARYQLATVTYEMGDLQRAAAQAHHVIQHADDFAPAHLLMANITLKLGDYRQAAVEFCRVLELQGPDANVYMALGRAFAHLHDVPQAISAFEAAFQLDPANEHACSAVARLAERQGNKDKAGEFYRKLLRFEGSQQLAIEALERLGLSAEVPPEPAPKKGKKGKKETAAAAPAAPAPSVTFQPPKMLDKSGLPQQLPHRQTSRLIGENGTQPLRPMDGAAPAARRQPPAPTTPLDNFLDGLNRFIDQTPLQGAINVNEVRAMVKDVSSKANDVVNRVKTGILSKVSRSAPQEPVAPPSRLAPSNKGGAPFKPPTKTAPLDSKQGGSGNLAANRPKPKP